MKFSSLFLVTATALALPSASYSSEYELSPYIEGDAESFDVSQDLNQDFEEDQDQEFDNQQEDRIAFYQAAKITPGRPGQARTANVYHVSVTAHAPTHNGVIPRDNLRVDASGGRMHQHDYNALVADSLKKGTTLGFVNKQSVADHMQKNADLFHGGIGKGQAGVAHLTTSQRHDLKKDAREFARTHRSGALGAGDYASTHAMAPGTESVFPQPNDPLATHYANPGGRAAARAAAGLPALYDGEDDEQDFEQVQDDQDFEDDQEDQDFEDDQEDQDFEDDQEDQDFEEDQDEE